MSWQQQKRPRKYVNYKNLSQIGHAPAHQANTPSIIEVKELLQNRISAAESLANTEISSLKQKLHSLQLKHSDAPDIGKSSGATPKVKGKNVGGQVPSVKSSASAKPTLSETNSPSGEIQEAYASILADIQALEHRLDLQFKQDVNVGLDGHEQYSRRDCLLLHGVPETTNSNEEKSDTLAIGVLKEHLKINVTSQDLARVHRLGKRSPTSSSPRPVIIKFLSYRTRSEVFRNKSKLKGSHYTITESLTRQRKLLFDKARSSFSVRSVWTFDGTIIVLMPNNQKRTIVTSDDLNSVAKDWNALNARNTQEQPPQP